VASDSTGCRRRTFAPDAGFRADPFSDQTPCQCCRHICLCPAVSCLVQILPHAVCHKGRKVLFRQSSVLPFFCPVIVSADRLKSVPGIGMLIPHQWPDADYFYRAIEKE